MIAGCVHSTVPEFQNYCWYVLGFVFNFIEIYENTSLLLSAHCTIEEEKEDFA